MEATLPQPGDVVRVRQRTWLVNDMDSRRYQSTLVRLSCLDDDAAGQALEVLWEHELDAEVVPDEPRLLDHITELDDPRMFGAYLNAIRWNCVTSTDKRLLQAPFRAGIDLKAYQLEPIRKALELPRVNVFIADDVGLGKTIEAGLILQELILRQRVDRVLVIAPPAVTLQWQEELEQRFGLQFALYNRDYISARRRERGFGVNPWTTHSRFIVSFAMLRGTRSRSGKGTQHLELLLNALKANPGRSLLIVDECHQVAPSTGSLYPIDSRTTRAIRELTPHFEHRLFLSATPHNGHSHSFASLLHLLDPQRFTRGVPIHSAKELAPVMVRRLKRHLRQHVGGFPERKLVDHTIDLSDEAPEVELGHLLARYDVLYRQCLTELPRSQQLARGLVVVNLHKRLLSSIRAFQHTLELHARGAEKTLGNARQQSLPVPPRRCADDDIPEDELDQREDDWVESASLDPGVEARAILEQMRAIARRHRNTPDARVGRLAAWIGENLCPSGRWNDRRVVVFTEYEHTLQWLRRVLPELLKTDCDQRIEAYTGRLGQKNREALKAAFNTSPKAHPVRILLATDAAREGINLQAHCADLFHFDLPWNPSRIEQRNGRIDRVLQPADEVRCHYFYVPNRPEDRVLAYVVRKLRVIREELGSLSEVVSARLAARFDEGIRDITTDDIDRLATPDDSALKAQAELEGEGAVLLQGDLEVLRRQLERSQRRLGYRTEHLQDAVDLGLRLVSDGGLTPIEGDGDVPSYALPDLDGSWRGVLASMRERPPEDAPRWHRPPVKPVTFRAAHRLDADSVQLHLGHPLVKRLLARFRAQGFAAHDLSRVTLLENDRDATRRVVAFGRLALFGHGASRLHEELIAVAARCTADGLEPFGQTGERTTIDVLNELLADRPRPHPDRTLQGQVTRRCPGDFSELWDALRTRAAESHIRAMEALTTRGRLEADEMQLILERQRRAIEEQFRKNEQLGLTLSRADAESRASFERDSRFMRQRLSDIDAELVSEPAVIRKTYDVVLHRFEPIGLVYLWPTS